MSRERVNLIGQRFGRLVVIERAEDHITKSGRKIKRWKCKCDCGNEAIVRHGNLRNGTTTSCGCFHKEMLGNMRRTHGLSCDNKRIYPLWKSIKYRCYNKNCKSYKDYGGRGIKMCDEWLNSPEAFCKWAIANGYKEEKDEHGKNILTIDRIDVNGNYEPSNCRFITNAEQAKNKRDSLTDEERYRKCPVCGKVFSVKSRTSTQKTCSRECCSILRTKRAKVKREKIKKNYSKICPICGKEFVVTDGHFNQRKYCSNECKNISNSPVWEFNGESLRVMEWAKKMNATSHCLLHRKEMGWSIERILTTPVKRQKNNSIKQTTKEYTQ